jgi:molecular chaperone HscC
VPAYFNDRQRKATIAAGQIAGLTVERILNEPTAAALAYGFRGGRESATILVFDLGGGTFDVSLVEQFEGSLEVRASAGETSLGGEDFTRTLAARILESQGQQFERAEMTAPAMVARVIQQCEKAKKTLSTAATATIRVPTAKGDMVAGTDVAVTREQLEQWIAPILSRIDAPIRRVMADARLTRDKIDDVILVGGATRMPVIVERVTDLFRKTPHSKLNPDEVVAMGAAVQAGLIGQNAAVEDLVVTDVSPFTLGVEISKEIGAVRTDGYFDPIIDRNSVIPVSRVKRYSTVHANQTEISIHVYQGENRRTKDNLKLAEFDVKGIPSGPPGQDVDIRFTYDLNGVLEVEATIVATGKKVSHIVAKHAKGLSQKDVARAVEAMAKLKVHPRDDAANHYVLARADRVFRELTAEKRHFLGVLIDGFEAALESRDPISINQHRETLESFLGNVDPDGDSGEAVPHDA